MRFWRQFVGRWICGYSFFICHAVEDARYAERVCAELERRRLLTFLDERSLFAFAGGGGVDARLTRAIGKSAVLLVVDSRDVRAKEFPALEIKAALDARCDIVRIEEKGNRQPWIHLPEAARDDVVRLSTRYEEEPDNIRAGEPSAGVIDKVATHLNWRRHWPWVHRSVLTLIACAGVLGLAAWHASRIAGAVHESPLRVGTARNAAHLFGWMAPLFARVAPGAMADVRTTLVGTYTRELRFTEHRVRTNDCPDAGKDAREGGPISLQALNQLMALDDRAKHWRVDPTGQYALAVRPSGEAHIFRVPSPGISSKAAAPNWTNGGNATACSSAFTADGSLLFLGLRDGRTAELHLLDVPSGRPRGTPVTLRGSFPLTIEAGQGTVMVKSEVGASELMVLPPPPGWTAARAYPRFGVLLDPHRVVLASGTAAKVEVCEPAGGALSCRLVWSDAEHSDDLAEIDSVTRVPGAGMTVTFHTPSARVTCDATPLACRDDATAVTRTDAPAAITRESADWRVEVMASCGPATECGAVVYRRGVYDRKHYEVSYMGPILDAEIDGDVLRLLLWIRDSVVVEELGLSDAWFRARASLPEGA